LRSFLSQENSPFGLLQTREAVALLKSTSGHFKPIASPMRRPLLNAAALIAGYAGHGLKSCS
jgi:hypothetical protein